MYPPIPAIFLRLFSFLHSLPSWLNLLPLRLLGLSVHCDSFDLCCFHRLHCPQVFFPILQDSPTLSALSLMQTNFLFQCQLLISVSGILQVDKKYLRTCVLLHQILYSAKVSAMAVPLTVL